MKLDYNLNQASETQILKQQIQVLCLHANSLPFIIFSVHNI